MLSNTYDGSYIVVKLGIHFYAKNISIVLHKTKINPKIILKFWN